MNKFNILSAGEILFDCFPDKICLGGAPFNFIYHIIKLTGNGVFISRIGEDDLGKKIKLFFEERNVSAAFLQTDFNHLTGKVDVITDENGIPDFTIKKNAAYDFIEINREILDCAKKSDLFYFGTLAQREGKSGNTILKLAENSKIRFLDLNLRKDCFDENIVKKSLELSTILKASEDEFNYLCRLFCLSGKTEKEKIKEICSRFNIKSVCVTKGENGSVIFNKGVFSKYKLPAGIIADTVGAGDAFSAILAIGYLSNWETDKISEIANKFAAATCLFEGALPLNDDFYNFYRGIIQN